tara:strand:+ start:1360 stop:2094 length:735 start_codon:yes stop_codon:yes gene_type:complete
MGEGSVNSVSVFSINEEKLKFRVIVAIDGEQYRQAPGVPAAVLDGDGSYDIDIPVPTALANSERYNQCLIKCDTFTAAASINSNTPTWATGIGVPGGGAAADGVAIKGSAIELQLGAASGQSSVSIINNDLAGNVDHLVQSGDKSRPVVDIAGYRQLIPGQLVNQGNGASFSVGAGGQGWLGMMRDLSPLLCANPFGQRMRIRFIDPLSRGKMCIMNALGLNNGDIGKYYLQFEVTMVPNSSGC